MFHRQPSVWKRDAFCKSLRRFCVHHVELWLEGKGKEARLIIAENLGDVDLMTLRDGVLLPLADLEDMTDLKVSKIRVVLDDEGHYGLKADGTTCSMKTPSAQQTGIKIVLSEPVTFENGYSYSLVIDFDAERSVVQQGNGGCLLKPVLKLPSFAKTPVENIEDDGGEPIDEGLEEPVTDGLDSNDTSGGDGFDSGDSSTWPEGISQEELDSYF